MALCRSSSADTENGEHGASATCRIEPNDGSWYFSMTSIESRIISSTVCTTESGGRPPSLTLRSIDPRDETIRMPSASAASICAPIRSPEPAGKT